MRISSEVTPADKSRLFTSCRTNQVQHKTTNFLGSLFFKGHSNIWINGMTFLEGPLSKKEEGLYTKIQEKKKKDTQRNNK